jgi:hypothetical protein
MSSFTSTGSYLSTMDDASTVTTSSTTSQSRTRSNSLFESPTDNIASGSRRRSNSLFENPTNDNNNSSRRNLHLRPRGAVTVENSVVQAMITSNNLRNCHEVEEMVVRCLDNKDKQSFVCKTAQRYIGGCQK